MAVQPETLLVSNIGETMGIFGSAVVQLAEAVKELNSQQIQQQLLHQQKMLEQQESQQQHHFLLQKLAEEHHLQLLQHQQQLLQQQQQQQPAQPQGLPQVGADYVPPAIEARLLLMEEVRFTVVDIGGNVVMYDTYCLWISPLRCCLRLRACSSCFSCRNWPQKLPLPPCWLLLQQRL
jgi:hypothetical protein